MSTRALVLALGVSGIAVCLWLNTSLKPRSSYGEAAQGAEAGDEEAPVWRLASGSSASDDEASRIFFFFFLSSAHATLIL